MDFPFECIHIAGTNGKGSTAAFAGAIMQAAGHVCGVYTSPHVLHPTERIRINGENIPEEALKRLMEKQEAEGAPTLFHAYTGAAFAWFAQNHVDFAVLETGLGGRLDPTNVVNSRICILTSIGIDHTELLGSDIEKIAMEKCGIIKPHTQVVTGEQRPEVMRVIERECAAKDCMLHVVRPQDIRIKRRALSGQLFDFEFKGQVYEGLQISMPGMRQPQNACLAAAACMLCGADAQAISKGLLDVKAIARFEYFAGNPPVVLDGAHNVDSAMELADTLRFYFAGREIVLLTALMADKDAKGVMEVFSSFAGEAITVKADEARGEDAGKIARILAAYGTRVQVAESIPAAFAVAKELAARKTAVLVISGSFYLAGKARRYCCDSV
jgi:dihydrofolate synthase/folylpolyglutamate synthase